MRKILYNLEFLVNVPQVLHIGKYMIMEVFVVVVVCFLHDLQTGGFFLCNYKVSCRTQIRHAFQDPFTFRETLLCISYEKCVTGTPGAHVSVMQRSGHRTVSSGTRETLPQRCVHPLSTCTLRSCEMLDPLTADDIPPWLLGNGSVLWGEQIPYDLSLPPSSPFSSPTVFSFWKSPGLSSLVALLRASAAGLFRGCLPVLLWKPLKFFLQVAFLQGQPQRWHRAPLSAFSDDKGQRVSGDMVMGSGELLPLSAGPGVACQGSTEVSLWADPSAHLGCSWAGEEWTDLENGWLWANTWGFHLPGQ